jgi:hypothetical protein
MIKNKMSFKYKECHEAATAGDLKELKKMHENGCPWDWKTTAYAAKNGHLECLKFAHENGCKWECFTPALAARNGHMKCLKYAHENGCPWAESTASAAALGGQLECLKYAHNNGCDWDVWTLVCAAENGHFECFKYCFEMWNEPQDFLKYDYHLSKIIDKIDLDDPLWRRLFSVDLSKHPRLQSKVNAKKQEIEKMKEASKDALQNKLPLDVIKYCLQPYF